MANKQWSQMLGAMNLIGLIVVLLGSVGCSRYPSAPTLPKVDPQEASEKLFSQYDENEDGKIVFQEGMKSVALQAAWRFIDKDEDGTITAEDVVSHVRSWQESPSYVVDARSTFYLDNQPLEGAKVTLVAADFLGDVYPSISTTTNAEGKAHFQLHDPPFPGIYAGVYKIQVSKQQDGQETIPAMYNSETIFACEYSNENWLACFRSYRLMTEEQIQKMKSREGQPKKVMSIN